MTHALKDNNKIKPTQIVLISGGRKVTSQTVILQIPFAYYCFTFFLVIRCLSA